MAASTTSGAATGPSWYERYGAPTRQGQGLPGGGNPGEPNQPIYIPGTTQVDPNVPQGYRAQQEARSPQGVGSAGEMLGQLPVVGGLVDMFNPSYANWLPSPYEPDRANFDMQLPTDQRTWQTMLANQADEQNAQARGYEGLVGQEYAGARASDRSFADLMNRGQTTDYGRAVGAYGQGQQGVDLLRGAALGQQPSAAEIAMARGVEQAQAGAQSMAASGPYNPAAGLVAQGMQERMAREAVSQGMQARAAEMAQSRGQYMGALGQQQGAAQGLAGLTGQQAGQWAGMGAQQRTGAGMFAGAGNAARNTALGYYGENRQVGAQQQQGGISYEQLRGQQRSDYNQARMKQDEFNAQAQQASKTSGQGMLGGLLAGAGFMSDEQSKTELASARDTISSLRQQLAEMSAGKAAVVPPSPPPVVAAPAAPPPTVQQPYTPPQQQQASWGLGQGLGQLLSDAEAKANLRTLVGKGQMTEEHADYVWDRLKTSPVSEAWHDWLNEKTKAPVEADDWRLPRRKTEPAPTDQAGWRAWLESKQAPATVGGASTRAQRYAELGGGEEPTNLTRQERQSLFGTSTRPAATGYGPAGELAKVPPVSFRYKPGVQAAYPGMTAPGTHYGVTAQALERAGSAGRAMVQPGPGGYKTIDVPQATGTLLAAVGQQQREIDELKRLQVGEGATDQERRRLGAIFNADTGEWEY